MLSGTGRRSSTAACSTRSAAGSPTRAGKRRRSARTVGISAPGSTSVASAPPRSNRTPGTVTAAGRASHPRGCTHRRLRRRVGPGTARRPRAPLGNSGEVSGSEARRERVPVAGKARDDRGGLRGAHRRAAVRDRDRQGHGRAGDRARRARSGGDVVGCCGDHRGGGSRCRFRCGTLGARRTVVRYLLDVHVDPAPRGRKLPTEEGERVSRPLRRSGSSGGQRVSRRSRASSPLALTRLR